MKTDLEIQKDVMEELSWQPSLNAAHIGVAANNGIVTLSGTVDTYLEKIIAEEATKKISGVRALAEDIEIKIKGITKKTDTEIAEEVMFALKWQSSVDENKIKVKVENGRVLIEGEVIWNFQKTAIKSAISNVEGVKGISCNILVNPLTVPADIKNRLDAAFHRNAAIDSDHIHISVVGSTVTLTGMIRSYSEMKDAEKATWLAPGVKRVVNLLEINLELVAS